MLQKQYHQVDRSTVHSQLYRKVKNFLKKNALLDKKSAVAVSGGLDSIVLYFILAEIYKNEGGVSPQAIYVSHQQRSAEQEKKDRECIEKLLIRFNADLIVVQNTSAVKDLSEKNLREFRREALLELCAKHQIFALFTGHHMDDQVEEFFIRLFSGAHFKGLSAMDTYQPPVFFKPFLQVPKNTLYAFAKDNRLSFNVDQSNASTDYTRNHIRHVLIPFLTAQYGQKFKSNVLQTIDDFTEFSDYLEQQAKKIIRETQLGKDEYERESLLGYHDLQLKTFFNLAFSCSHNQLNSDQLNTLLKLLFKGQGQYALQQGVVFKVTQKKIRFVR